MTNPKIKKMLSKIHKNLLAIIVLLSLLLRFTYLDKFPSTFNQDEAAKAYNGYSLLKTGRSFRGLKWPLYLTDFSDKLPFITILYTYSTIPFIALFGLNETAARLPAATFGTATIFVLYLLTLQLFKKPIALLAAFFLAISPWHILMSRVALEPVTFPFFFLLGWYFLEKGLQEKERYFYIGFAFLGISFYTYQVALFLTPTFILAFIFIYRKLLNSQKILLIKSLLVLFLIISPIIFLCLTQPRDMTLHLEEVSIKHFGYLSPLVFAVSYVTNFLFPFLIFYYHFPVVYFATISFIKIIKKVKENSHVLLLVSTFFLSLIPSSLSINSNYGLPNVTRSIGKTGFVEIFAAYSAYHIINNYSKYKKRVLYISLPIIFVLNSILLLLIGYPYYFESDLYAQYGWKEVVNYIKSVEKNYDKVVITDKANQPFIFILFYNKYPPEKFQNTRVIRSYTNSPYPFEIVHKFDKYEFCNLDECFDPNANNLYIARENEIAFVEEKFTIQPIRGRAFRIIDN